MNRRFRLALVALVLVLGTGIIAPEVALSQQVARQRWARFGLRHYQVEMKFVSQWRSAHTLLEVRDGRLIDGIDLDGGDRLSAVELRAQAFWMPIDRLFDQLEVWSRRMTWMEQVAGVAPWLAQQLQWCVETPVQVRYDERLGYPAELRFGRNVCRSSDDTTIYVTVLPLDEEPDAR